jgi:eukaryotic-like serine/threonine-protein kinase
VIAAPAAATPTTVAGVAAASVAAGTAASFAAYAPAGIPMTASDDDADPPAAPRPPRRALKRPVPATGDAAHDERLERKRHRRREALGALLSVFWLLVAIGLLGGIVYGAYYFWVQGAPPDVTVPKYVGKSQADAARALQSKGLKMVIGSEVYDPKRPAGTVIKGDTEAGKYVKSGREVTVTVSRGEEPIKMPELIELDLQRARQIIERGGMRLGMVADQYHDTIPQGYICGQYPEPGQSFRRSEPINLIVSKGPQPLADATDPSQLPPPPPRTPPSLNPEAAEESITNPPKAPEVPMVSRTVAVRVAIPADGDAKEVRIVVRDAEGEHTVYRQTHAPGDLIDETVEVTRQQGTTAIVRVYVDGKLEREQRI